MNYKTLFSWTSLLQDSKFLFVVFLWLGILAAPAYANNITVANVSGVSQSTSADTLQVEFDLSWNNSWRDSTNYDAAWVFVKYSTDSGTTWVHATMATAGTNPSGVSRGTKSSGAFNSVEIIVSADKKGAFIQPAHPGSGTLNFTNIQLVWDYGADGVSDGTAIASSTYIKVFALEMVYVPQGGFYVGDTVVGTNSEFQYGGSATGNPPTVSSEAGISFGSTASQWYYTTDAGANDATSGSAFELNAAFPKGYNAMYVMKYEITEGGYVGFLNTLSRLAQNKRVQVDVSADAPASGKTYVLANASNANSAARNTVQCPASGNGTTAPIVFTTDRTDRACIYLTWMDVAAYLDWAALRPMTELEFEKACRGPIYPVSGEYAWGTSTITACATISGTENGTETCSTSNANTNYNNTTFSGGDASGGALRAGIFATSATVTRVTSGASYWGAMDLSGNAWERVVSVGLTGGRAFAGTHGDGILISLSSYEGNASNVDWPGISSTTSQGVSGATGIGQRGGGLNSTTAARLKISDRNGAGTTDTARQAYYGGRGVRTASA